MIKENTLVVVAGPTAVGKTAFCIQLGLHFNTDIISADSRQLFKEIQIGTAKPSVHELQTVKHHFIDHLSIKHDYDVKTFEKEALEVIENILNKHNIAILTGGSGMYIKAVTDGFDDMPSSDPGIRAYLNQQLEEKGIEALQQNLLEVDEEYYYNVDKNNPQRIIRALEVYMISNKPFSSFRTGKTAGRDFNIIKVGLERHRAELYDKIDQRMDAMIIEGLFEEAEKLFPYRSHNALQTVGYKEIFDFIEGKYDKEEAIRLLKRNSRRYAKRQMTWFKKDPGYRWFHPDRVVEVVKYIEEQVK